MAVEGCESYPDYPQTIHRLSTRNSHLIHIEKTFCTRGFGYLSTEFFFPITITTLLNNNLEVIKEVENKMKDKMKDDGL
jgi:hypothetical protein